mmetsp:Transcript_3430/g.5786  ORF Transcript_3430/g.5786 Transcript_3430/m.5786 type:complete len:87 (+) Transcript_3430:97-357(+)
MKKVFFFFSSPERSQQIRPCVNKEASFASFAYSDVLIDIEHLQPTLSFYRCRYSQASYVQACACDIDIEFAFLLFILRNQSLGSED